MESTPLFWGYLWRMERRECIHEVCWERTESPAGDEIVGGCKADGLDHPVRLGPV